MKLSEMKQMLAADDIRLTRSLGQSFLHDNNQLNRIVALAALSEHDRVLEVGPGLGPLTELLVEHAAEVLAIEKDSRLVELLRRRFAAAPRRDVLHLLHDDALDYLKRAAHDWTGWKLVANLPYSVASPILVELALAPGGPQMLVATLQLEVARRLIAEADAEDYGVLSLLVQLHYAPRQWFKIPASCFFPEPAVDSACVCLDRRPRPRLDAAQQTSFIKIVKRGFSQRRKTLFKLLKEDWPLDVLARSFSDLSLPLLARAESLSLENFCQLACRLDNETLPNL